MSAADTTDCLDRVLEILERSFPQYMLWARPYVPPGRENVMPVIETIVAGQDSLAERVSQQISESGGLPDHGKFPTDFTDTHDLAIDFLVEEAIDCLKQDIADLEKCVDELRLAPAAQALASEARGLTKGHLEQLEKLRLGTAAPSAGGPQPALSSE
jgi:hypothetical protein